MRERFSCDRRSACWRSGIEHWGNGTCDVEVQLTHAKSVETFDLLDVANVAAEAVGECVDGFEGRGGGGR